MGPASELGEDGMKNLAGLHKRQQERRAPARPGFKARKGAVRNWAKEMADLRRRIRELRTQIKRLRAESNGYKCRICPKCSGKVISLRYDRGRDECLRENRGCENGEHLHFCCRECGYDWCGPIEPPEEPKPAPNKG
jgi:hypothetical protein